MVESDGKIPVKVEAEAPGRAPPRQTWQPFESLRRPILDAEPFRRRELSWRAGPAVDIAEEFNAYEVTAELPGVDEKDIEVKLVNGKLVIKGEKQERRKKDYYLRERHFGSFERYFVLPEDADTSKIEASFEKGVLTVTLPKKPEVHLARHLEG
jgi:HSP20 family protein